MQFSVSVRRAATKSDRSLPADSQNFEALPRSASPRCLIKPHLCRRRLSHLIPSSGYAGAGGARSRAISDRHIEQMTRG
jgi:hypothetical protein